MSDGAHAFVIEYYHFIVVAHSSVPLVSSYLLGLSYDEAAADADCAADEVEGDLLETTHLSGAAGESSREHLSLQRSDIASSVTAAAAAAGTPTETLFRIPMQFRQTLVQDYVRGAHYNTHFQASCMLLPKHSLPSFHRKRVFISAVLLIMCSNEFLWAL